MTFVLLFVLVFALLALLFWAIGPTLERLLRWSANRTARFRYRDYLPVFVALAIGIGLTALAGDTFLDLAESVQENSPAITDVDAEVHSWARTTRESGATTFFTVMTVIGTPVGLGALTLIAALALAMRKRWRWAAYLVFTNGVGGLLNLQLKSLFARARPELADALRDAHGYSFPSGHAMGSTIVFAAFAYLAFRIIPRWRYRAIALSLACTMITAICASRIYLGVHWISDIVGGVAAGTIWFAATTVAYETFRRIRLVRALRQRSIEPRTSLGE